MTLLAEHPVRSRPHTVVTVFVIAPGVTATELGRHLVAALGCEGRVEVVFTGAPEHGQEELLAQMGVATPREMWSSAARATDIVILTSAGARFNDTAEYGQANDLRSFYSTRGTQRH